MVFYMVKIMKQLLAWWSDQPLKRHVDATCAPLYMLSNAHVHIVSTKCKQAFICLGYIVYGDPILHKLYHVQIFQRCLMWYLQG